MEDRIIEIEKKIAFQEHTIEQLSQVLIEQQKKIENLEELLKVVQAQISDEELVKPQEEEEPPPHYWKLH